MKSAQQNSNMKCDGCQIVIGIGHIEAYPYQVGDYEICGWCLRELQRRGRLQVGDRSGKVALYLHPDGKVFKEQIVKEE